MRDKSIQIPELMYKQMCAYILTDAPADPERAQLQAQIQQAVFDKIDRQIAHDLYSKSKTAPTEAEKERARQAYLDAVGIPKDFRW